MRAPSPLAAALYEVADPRRFAWRCVECSKPVPFGDLFCADTDCEEKTRESIDALLGEDE